MPGHSAREGFENSVGHAPWGRLGAGNENRWARRALFAIAVALLSCGEGTGPGVDGPAISRTPASLTFTAQQGTGNSASQPVAVTNSGGGSLSGLGTAITYATGSGWLQASLDQTTAPATLTVQALTGSLTAGTYTATVDITSAVATNNAQPIAVTFTVTEGPAISRTPASLSFTAQQGAGNSASQPVAVTNSGGGTLSGLGTAITYTTGSGWLQASLDQTTAPATLTLQALTGSLTAGTYTATVDITSAVATNNAQPIAVSFTVTEGPAISRTPASLTFTAQQGAGNSASQPVAVTNSGGGSLSGLGTAITYTTGSGWLQATLDQTTAPAILTVQALTGSLTAGTYTATVDITSAAATNNPQPIAVTFTVVAQPTVANAGPDANATLGVPFMLDGRASTGTNLTYTWTPVAWDATFGTPPTLMGATPSVTSADVQKVVYELTVTDGVSTSADRVELMVLEDPGHAVFVAAGGDDAGAGTRAQPMRTVAAAVSRADAIDGDVYIAGDPPSVGDLVLASGVSLYGGFDASWMRNAGNPAGWPRLSATAAPVRGDGVSNIVLEGVRIQPSGLFGINSIGLVLSNASDIRVRYASIQTLPGALGTRGTDGTNGRAGDNGGGGHNGTFIPVNGNGNFCVPIQPGVQGINYRLGGAGGIGGCTIPSQGGWDGMAGSIGLPPGGTLNVAAGGLGGASITFTQRGSLGGFPGGPGQPGQSGAAGTDGTNGVRAAFSPTYPFVTQSSGQSGSSGRVGGGGGGGGGAGGLYLVSIGSAHLSGAGGGGGGGGGEFGTAATGGSPGGSSIGMILFNVTGFSISHSQITTGNGGTGGDGGSGGAGGTGGSGGAGGVSLSDPSCSCGNASDPGGNGGAGGAGGRGGHSGGGAGGNSVGILHHASAPAVDVGVIYTGGVEGVGGLAGLASLGRAQSGLRGLVVSY